jgi:NAD(P)-dependent dehydrogenase (short-subunit alcohol dehydrogenase family)
VALLDVLPQSELQAARKQVSASEEQALALACDIRDSRAVEQVIQEVCQRLGGLHLVVNNAGVTADGVLWKMSDEEWRKVIDTNLTGSFNLIRAAAPTLRQQRFGRIVNISSINALRGKFGQANYSASKAGILGLTLSAAKELARENITVNAIAPGFIETEMTSRLPEAIVAEARAQSLLGRLGRPADVASAVLFFCSDGAEHITGTVLRVDGGQCI